MNEPTPARIDKLCAERAALKLKSEKADEALAAKDSEILALVHQFGKAVEGSDKSLRLEGKKYQATSIGGMTSSLDDNGVLQFKLALVKAHCGQIFKKFFVASTKFTVAAGAEQALADLPPKAPKNLANLFHSCMTFKPKKARLDVAEIGGKAKAR